MSKGAEKSDLQREVAKREAEDSFFLASAMAEHRWLSWERAYVCVSEKECLVPLLFLSLAGKEKLIPMS